MLVRSCLSLSLLLSVMSITTTTTTAFTFPSVSKSFVSSRNTNNNDNNNRASSNTRLYISSWTKGSGSASSRWTDNALKNPEERIQDYLKEPAAVEARTNIDGICLVSGLVNAKDRTDQFLFDLLNHEDSAFEYNKIIAFVDDAKFSKKRLLSRSARYTGLLDKLDFVQANSVGSLPTPEQLTNVKSWLAVVGVTETGVQTNAEKINQMIQIAEIAKAVPSIENIAVLVMNANEMDVPASQQVVQALEGTGKKYTIVVVGTIEDRPEGKTFYHYGEFGTDDGVLPISSVFSREESYRMITELLQLECGVNKALSFAEIYNSNITEAKLIKGLREAGYARPQEIDHMIREGPEAYKAAIEKYRKEYPDSAKGYTTNAWWEAEEFQKSRRRSAERTVAQEQLVKDTRTMEIEEIAKEWAKREYFRQSMAGTIENDMSEEEYTKSVWDRAMFEGDQKYRIMKGEAVDEEVEFATFQQQQERKKQVMLDRAKQELKDILQSDLKDDDDKDKK